MKITRKRIAVLGSGMALAAGTLIPLACSNQLNDLGGIGQVQPDYAITILNVDGFPNITLLCYKGVAFATTTRENTPAAAQLVHGWDAFCATYDKNATPPTAVIPVSGASTPASP